ncbi:MAG: LysR family transcriptional regulator [Roseibium sp.]|uniref:LysR family transcriptional regulator n=1 Tax=Roseibium sp. TaxID=1936156 RepID=UPI0026379480|nr:LysR family transcriptional regulator [Roseibium sp.]MCV0424509.1 LysR family transcriptional regulator [Roseibium sp.]
MNIKALRAFRYALSEGTVAAASELLHLSQPAVSRLISGLEAELKLDLFDRSGRSLTPTPEGVAFYREAGRILDNLDEVRRIADEIRAGRSQKLRVVTMPRIAQFLSAPAVVEFSRKFPEVNVSVDLRARREAGKWLAGQEYDIGIGALPVRHPEIRTVPLLRVRALAILPKDHALAGEPAITTDMLGEETIIRLMPGLLLRDQLDDMFHSAGITPASSIEVSSSQFACALAAQRAGVTIADEMVAEPFGDLVKTVPIVPERWMTFGLLYSRRADPAQVAIEFERLLKDHVRRVCTLSQTMQDLTDVGTAR